MVVKKEKILITGVSGFVGQFLADFFIERGYFVYGADIKKPGTELFVKKNFQFIKLDLLDYPKLKKTIEKITLAGVVHLAGSSQVSYSWVNPIETFRNNISGGWHLLEALAGKKFKGKIIFILSGEEYGLAGTKKMPFLEESCLAPRNPYAASKAALDFIALGFFLGCGLKIIRIRPFNHIGPGQNEAFVVSDFAKQIALIEARRQKPQIAVGNLNVKRDFLDVRDIVAAYYSAYQKGIAGEVYNLASGRAVSIRKILDIFLKLARVKIKVKISPKKFRKTDEPVSSGSYRKFKKKTGWWPTISLEKSLLDTLNYWRGKIKKTERRKS